MSTTDRAFIRAYSDAEAALPPHGPQPAADAPPHAASVERRSPGQFQPSAGRTQGTATGRYYLPRPHVLFPSEEHTGQPGPRSAEVAAPQTEDSVRRPLSQFAVGAPQTPDFRAAFEVERFLRPPICCEFDGCCSEALDALALRVEDLLGAGQNVLAVVGNAAGVGCTTLTVSLADRLVARRQRVVVVDADWERAELATALGIAPLHGWEEVLRGDLALQEAVVQATAEPLAAVLAKQVDPAASAHLLASLRASTSVEILRNHYDLVLLDYGAAASQAEESDPVFWQLGVHAVIGVASTIAMDQSAWETLLGNQDIELAGIIHNFQPHSG